MKRYIRSSSRWIGTLCPVYNIKHFKIIQDYIQELRSKGYGIGSHISTTVWDENFEKERKDKEKTKYYHPEWFEHTDPLGLLEFFCSDFDNNYNCKAEKKVLNYAISLMDE